MGSTEKLNVVVLASGSASTAYEIYRASSGETEYGHVPRINISAVVISNSEAGESFSKNPLGLSEVKIVPVLKADFKEDEAYGEALMNAIKPLCPDIVGQFGHTPKTPKNALDGIRAFWINQHGADPQLFGGKGMCCPERFLAASLIYSRLTGRNWNTPVSQRVGVEFDEGPVIKTGLVRIHPDDNVYSLKKRNIKEEYCVQIEALNDIAEGVVKECKPPKLTYQEQFLSSTCRELATLLYTNKGIQVPNPKLHLLVNIPYYEAAYLTKLLEPK